MKADYSEELKGIIDGTQGGAFIGGTLGAFHAMFSPSEWTVSTSGDNGKCLIRDMSEQEKFYFCQIYVQNKTPNHAFSEKCSHYLDKTIVQPIVLGVKDEL